MSKVSFDVIEKFLEGKDPQKYIVGIESSYSENFVDLVINDPETGKRLERHDFKPFIWLKRDVRDIMYQGKSSLIREAMRRYNVKIKPLNITSEDENKEEEDEAENNEENENTTNSDSILGQIDKYGNIIFIHPESSTSSNDYNSNTNTTEKSNMNTYYKDFVATSNPTIIFESFISDIANDVNMDSQTLNQFKKRWLKIIVIILINVIILIMDVMIKTIFHHYHLIVIILLLVELYQIT